MHFDAVGEVGSAGANVAAEHVAAVALVVNSAGAGEVLVAQLGRVAENVDGNAANGREENVEVGAGDELGEHAASLLEQAAAEVADLNAEALGDARQVPHVFEGYLRAVGSACVAHDLPVDANAPLERRFLDLLERDVRLGY